MENYILTIKRVLYTLNLVNVQGRDNLESLFASIVALEEMQQDMETEARNANQNK